MKFKDKTVGGHRVRNIECLDPIKLYCVSAEVFIHTEWLTLTFMANGILNINNPDSKFNLVEDES